MTLNMSLIQHHHNVDNKPKMTDIRDFFTEVLFVRKYYNEIGIDVTHLIYDSVRAVAGNMAINLFTGWDKIGEIQKEKFSISERKHLHTLSYDGNVVLGWNEKLTEDNMQDVIDTIKHQCAVYVLPTMLRIYGHNHPDKTSQCDDIMNELGVKPYGSNNCFYMLFSEDYNPITLGLRTEHEGESILTMNGRPIAKYSEDIDVGNAEKDVREKLFS